MRKKLEVKDLAVSFHTPKGSLKAVRGIDLTLYEGETLAIVGESGSGKSVSSKAMMGILAPNAVVERGEIWYEGKNLLQLRERELLQLRGDKIAMVFQDPMSILNPIVRIGRQLTEAMLIKNRLRRRQAAAELRGILRTLSAASPRRNAFRLESRRFLRIARESGRREAAFWKAREAAAEALRRIGVLRPVYEKKSDAEITSQWDRIYLFLKEAVHPDGALKALENKVQGERSELRRRLDSLAEQLARYPQIPDYFDEICKKEEGAGGKTASVDGNGFKESFLTLVQEALEEIKKKKSKAGAAPKWEQVGTAAELVEKMRTCAYAANDVLDKATAKQRAVRLMDEVGIPESEKRFRQYPFQLSGGQRQRIVIAITLSADPDILICDEPTTALDVTIQSQILELINRVKRERKLSVLFITHDLGVVANIADRVAVMYAGKIVEYGTTDELFYTPAHPYTWALLSSVPDPKSREKLAAIPGTLPDMLHPPVGDAFAARNPYALEIDFEEEPPMFPITKTHCAASWLLHPYAPKVEMPGAVAARIADMRRREAMHE